MPMVDGKKYAYTEKGKKQALAAKLAKVKTKSDGYGPNPADMPKVNEDGIRQLNNLDKMSKSTMKNKDKAKGNAKQARTSYPKTVTKIPASPTR